MDTARARDAVQCVHPRCPLPTCTTTTTIIIAIHLPPPQLSCYDEVKHLLINHGFAKEGTLLHFSVASVAGLLTAVLSNPVDMLKSHAMNSTGKSMPTLIGEIWARSGFFGFFRGAMVSYVRIAPHTTVSLTMFEMLRTLVGGQPL